MGIVTRVSDLLIFPPRTREIAMAFDRKAHNSTYRKIWKERNKEKVKGYYLKSQAKHRERLNAQKRVENMSEEEHSQALQSWKDLYQKNREKNKAYHARVRLERGDEIRARGRAYVGKWRALYGACRQQVKNFAAAHNLTHEEAGVQLRDILIKGSERVCAICNRFEKQIVNMGSSRRQGFHLDHINGNNQDYSPSNLQLLCWKCNTTKLDLPLCEESKILIKQHTDLYFAKMLVIQQIKAQSSCTEDTGRTL
jgi:hypothetical protein